jgi:lysophospholipase L1-like esterase
MKNKRALLVVFAVFLFTAWTSVVGATRIMPLGDSITKGLGSGPDHNGYRRPLYFKLVENGFEVDFVGSQGHGSPDFDLEHEGYPGRKAQWIAERVGGFLKANPCHVVLLHIGTNDLRFASVGDIPGIVKNVEDILEKIDEYSTNIKVILARIINTQKYVCHTSSLTSTFNEQLQAMAETRIATKGDKIVIVDMECGARIDYFNGMNDTYHPNNNGYEKIADAWYNSLVQVLTTTPARPKNFKILP